MNTAARLLLVSVLVQPLVAQKPGLLGEYFRVSGNIKDDAVPPSQKPFFVRVDKQVNHPSTNGAFNKTKLADNLFAQWTGTIRIAKAGAYRFATESDDGSRLYIDGKRVVDNWGPHGMKRVEGTVQLAAGDHAIKITFNEGGGGAGCIVTWIVPGGSREVAIPPEVLFHDAKAKQAAMARFDRAAWKKIKRPKRRKGGGGISYPATAGPVIATAVNLGADAKGTNTVYRGIVVRLDAEGKVCMLFDADTMRMASAWADGSLNFVGLPFTTGHGAYPRVDGKQIFRLRATPGWSKGAALADPRAGEYPPLGHLPKDWAHYKGLYMRDGAVALSYTVGASKVLESPSMMVDANQQTTVVRTFEIDRAGAPLTLVLMDAERAVKIAGSVASRDADADGEVTTVGVSKVPGKLAVRDGSLVLDLPAGKGVSRFSVSYVRAPAKLAAADHVTKFHPVDFAALRKGGAPRWPNTIKTKGQLASKRDVAKKPYVIDRVTVPYGNEYEPKMRIGGMDFFSDGTRAAVSTWDGDVWIVSGIDGDLDEVTWKRFATGLHEPLGLKIVDDVVYTVDDMQITRFHDLNGDGEADYYENFNNDWQLTSGFHAFCFDLHTDAQGRFYFAFGSPVRGGGRSFERMGDHHGSIMRVAKDGSTAERFATGLRAPNGIGVGPNGQVTSGDNEGTFVPRCPIHWIEPGEFLGVVDSASAMQRASFKTTATRTDRVPNGRKKHLDASEMPKPLAWLPHSVDNSGGGQAWVTSDRWGPLSGNLLHMSYGKSSLFLVLKEKKGDLMQGGIVRFPLRFTSSCMRARFNPKDGQLYVAGLKGWQTNAVKEGGFDRVRYTGKPLAMPVAMRTSKTGVELTFSDALDPELANDPESFSVRAADIRWTQSYGAKELKIGQRQKTGKLQGGWSDLKVTAAKLSSDGKTVEVTIDGFQPVHELEISIDVETTEGARIKTKIHGTVHAVE